MRVYIEIVETDDIFLPLVEPSRDLALRDIELFGKLRAFLGRWKRGQTIVLFQDREFGTRRVKDTLLDPPVSSYQ